MLGLAGRELLAVIAMATVAALAVCLHPRAARSDLLTREQLAGRIMPPFSLGEPVNGQGVWTLLNSGGATAGFVFETEPLAPLPGFSGAPINALVMLDLDGRFMDVRLLSQNEPVFVSGLGTAPFHRFFQQYRGHSISTPMVVGTPYGGRGAGSSLVYLDGVTKATASVRIAHESVLAATLAVAREKMQGVATGPPARPDPDHDETLRWADLVAEGLVSRKTVLNRDLDQAFAGTLWESDDPEAQDDPDGVYLDLWVVDLGPPSIARAVLDDDAFEELQLFLAISPDDEPVLVIDTGRHGLVSDAFVRNTAPDRLAAHQDGLPVALRDADLSVTLGDAVPEALHDGTAMILRADRRLGFDPTRDWQLDAEAVREHGVFRPEIGRVTLSLSHVTDERFFVRQDAIETRPPWQGALLARQNDLIVLGGGLAGLFGVLALGLNRFAAAPHFPAIRFGVLAAMVAFVGFWAQGQLSIVTVLGAIRATWDGGSLSFLLYDPFSLLVWAAAVVGAVVWGRGLFCGWLCPFGALQEFMHKIGRWLRLPTFEPARAWDARLKGLKYLLLAGLLVTPILAPQHVETVAEVEPFKTVITVFFVREWYYVVYAALWLILGLFLFKGFCRYVCPLGAVMAIAGWARRFDWIERREACGSPCQLCTVRCPYGAIARSGRVDYSECFQCLDCVTIHDDPRKCVPLILAARAETRAREPRRDPSRPCRPAVAPV